MHDVVVVMKNRTIIIFCLIGFVNACSKGVNIPPDKYGVLLRFGRVEAYAGGPAAMDKQLFVESVILLNKRNEFVINGTRYSYFITDPAKYYKLYGNGSERLQKYIAKNVKKHTSKRAHQYIEELIERESLPINLLKS